VQVQELIKQTGAYLRRVYIEVPEELTVKKGNRITEVDKIIVKVVRLDGTELFFNGDETSQNRMIRAYTVMKAKNLTAIPWRMADNNTLDVSADEFIDALELAGIEQGKVWFI
jgi:hypothetical protein